MKPVEITGQRKYELSDEDLGKNIEEYVCSDDDSADESWKEMFPDGMNLMKNLNGLPGMKKKKKEKKAEKMGRKEKDPRRNEEKEEEQKKIDNRSSKMRQNLINSIIEEFSKVDPKTGDIPELSDLWKKIEKIYEEDKKKIMEDHGKEKER